MKILNLIKEARIGDQFYSKEFDVFLTVTSNGIVWKPEGKMNNNEFITKGLISEWEQVTKKYSWYEAYDFLLKGEKIKYNDNSYIQMGGHQNLILITKDDKTFIYRDFLPQQNDKIKEDYEIIKVKEEVEKGLENSFSELLIGKSTYEEIKKILGKYEIIPCLSDLVVLFNLKTKEYRIPFYKENSTISCSVNFKDFGKFIECNELIEKQKIRISSIRFEWF